MELTYLLSYFLSFRVHNHGFGFHIQGSVWLLIVIAPHKYLSQLIVVKILIITLSILSSLCISVFLSSIPSHWFFFFFYYIFPSLFSYLSLTTFLFSFFLYSFLFFFFLFFLIFLFISFLWHCYLLLLLLSHSSSPVFFSLFSSPAFFLVSLFLLYLFFISLGLHPHLPLYSSLSRVFFFFPFLPLHFPPSSSSPSSFLTSFLLLSYLPPVSSSS